MSLSGSMLPPLKGIEQDQDALSKTLTTLFEGSPTLQHELVPQVVSHLQSLSTAPISSYSDLIDISLQVIARWDNTLKAGFIAGHPRIGEQKNLSHLSSKEQAAAATPPEVLARLAHLNACYEQRYPGLRYITFVNGRTRATIMKEMEDALGLERSLNPDDPEIDSIGQVDIGSEEWVKELVRAVRDVGMIAKSRLGSLGVE